MSATDDGAPLRYTLTPEQAYDLMLAALNIVTRTPSPATLKRCRADLDTGRTPGAYPKVNPLDLARLANVLDAIAPGIVERAQG